MIPEPDRMTSISTSIFSFSSHNFILNESLRKGEEVKKQITWHILKDHPGRQSHKRYFPDPIRVCEPAQSLHTQAYVFVGRSTILYFGCLPLKQNVCHINSPRNCRPNVLDLWSLRCGLQWVNYSWEHNAILEMKVVLKIYWCSWNNSQ